MNRNNDKYSIGIELSEGRSQPQTMEVNPPATGEPLSPEETGLILSRLPALPSDSGQQTEFKLPPEILPPPQPGNKIEETFPPHEAGSTPETVDTGPLKVMRFAPEGEIPIAPFVSVTFSQPMVPLGTLANLSEKDVPVKIEPSLSGTWRWLGTKTLTLEYDSKLIDGTAMAKIVNLLTAMEKKEGGPYKTWLVSESANKAWKDVDLAVNSNIGYFLSLEEIELENIDELINLAIEKEQLNSQYYPSIYPVVYFISRWFKSEKLIKIILAKKKKDNWENPLNTALVISSLLNLGVEPKILEPSINYLIKNQKKDVSWKTNAFCIDPAINKKTYYAGSPALTTAFRVEALNKYFLTTNHNLTKKPDKMADKIHQEIQQIAQKRTNF